MILFNFRFLLDLIFHKKIHVIKLKKFIKLSNNSKYSVIEIKPDDYLEDNHFPNAIIFWNIKNILGKFDIYYIICYNYKDYVTNS